MAVSPADFIAGLYRRGGILSSEAKKTLRAREDQLRLLNRGDEEDEAWRAGVFPRELLQRLPYKVVEEIKILGVRLDTRLGFTSHIAEFLQRASLRHGVMARLARSTWGLKAGILRSTSLALLSSLTAYGLGVVGSGAYARAFEKMGTQGVHIAARRITRISRSARLETLHAAAGTWSIHNQYL